MVTGQINKVTLYHSISTYNISSASEMGLAEAVRALVGAGADGRSHPVTRYSPLYVACYHGNRDIAETLLLHFPEMMQVGTYQILVFA